MANACEWRDKPGAEPNCKVLPVSGTNLCPRHTMMRDVLAQQRLNKAHADAAAEEAGVASIGPRTRMSLLKAGYIFKGHSNCRGCGAVIEWWRTPKLKNAPYDPMPFDGSFATSHFSTCKQAAAYRKAS